MKTETKDIAYYTALPYTIHLKRDEDGDIVARIEELTGCVAHGSSEAEALKNLAEVQRLWIEARLGSGNEIPEPEEEEALPSGKWVQRVPRTLHQKLIRVAKREGVSLNQLVTSILAEGAERAEFSTLGRQLLAEVKRTLTEYQHIPKRSMNELYREGSAGTWQISPEQAWDVSILSATKKTLKMIVPKNHETHYERHVNQKEISTYCH